MESLFNSLNEVLSKYYVVEGFSYQLERQVNRLASLIHQKKPKAILEIGFNGGHGSLLFLALTAASPETKVVSFDLGEYQHVFAAKRYIDSVFPGRHTLITGDSTKTVADYLNLRKHYTPVPPEKFDFIFIDGGHAGDVPLHDCVNCLYLASEDDHVVSMDDINFRREYAQPWNKMPTYAWTLMRDSGFLKQDGYDQYYYPELGNGVGRGMAWGQFNVAAARRANAENGTRALSNLFYKQMTREGMFNRISEMYHSRDLKNLHALAQMYLDYFGELDADVSAKVRFYQAFSILQTSPLRAGKLFEAIMDDKTAPEDIKFYSMCNLGHVYPAPAAEIPKLIHLLFFGETEFHNYHHRCVHSMLQHMPSYRVRIYNCKEPVGNKYWDSVKSHPNVEVVPVDVPEQFDGFMLNHFQYKADVVRLEVLYEHGGVYLDLDMLIVKNFEHLFASGHSLYLSKEAADRDCLINAFMAAKPKNEFLKIWLDAFKSGLRMNNWAYHIRETNMNLLRDHPHYAAKYRINLLNGVHFFPVHFQQRHIFEDVNGYAFPEDAYGVHLWETILGDVMVKNHFFQKEKMALQVYKQPEFADDARPDPRLPPQPAAQSTQLTQPIQLSISEITDPVSAPVPAKKKIDPASVLNITPNILVLCLQERPARTEYITSHLTEMGLPHTLMINNIHSNPVVGCFRSHMKAIKYAKDHNFEKVLILEDDVIVRDSINDLLHVALPEEWDILYFGGVMTKYQSSSPNGKWITGTFWCNHAYLVKQHMYDAILDLYLNHEDIDYLENMNIDYFYSHIIQPKYKVWLAMDQYVIQKEGVSDITGKVKWDNNFDWSTFAMKYIAH